MENQTLKSRIISSALRRYHDVLDQYQSRISKLRSLEPANSQKAGSSRAIHTSAMMRLLQNQLLFINEEMNALYNLGNSNYISQEVKPGSVVVTDKGIFFISLFVDSFRQDGKDISCVSEQSPFYLRIQGKKCGDEFSFEEKTHKIIEIY